MSSQPVTTIAQIKDLPDDVPVILTRGTLTAIHERKTGSNTHGDWSFQNLTIKDSTGEIKVKFKDRDELSKSDKNKVIEIAAYHSDKGWTGSKTKDDSYEKGGKAVTDRVLYVTGSADISFVTDGQRSAPAKAPEKPAQQQQEVHQPYDAPHEPATDAAPVHPLTGARHWLMQWANGYVMCFDAACYVAAQVESRTGKVLSLTDIKDIATSASIGFAKEMNISALPGKPLPPKPAKVDTASLKPSQMEEPPPQQRRPAPTPPAKKKDELDPAEDDIPF